MTRRDTWLPERMRAHSAMTRGEHRLHAGLISAMTVWLDTAHALVLGQPLPDTGAALLADAGDPTPEPDLDAARASFGVWEHALQQHVFPVLDEAFGEAFAANQRAADISVVHWQELAMATVHDRLKIWPEGAFEELRPELLEAMANNEDIDQVQDRIGRILGIDAPARRIRAEISAVDRKLKDPTTPRAEIPILKGKRRQLWNQHDERNLEWQWLARRIARTEIQAAMEAGALAAAQASEEITGDKMYKRWLATHDERTRLSHAVADGQMVRLTEPFIVGGTPIQHPADPAGVAHETINCRCTLAILSWSEMQAELQGMWGGRGVGPMNARLGPDDEAAVATAIDRLARERNGEVVDEPTTTTAVTEGASEELGRKREFREEDVRRDKGKFAKKAGVPHLPDGDSPKEDSPKGGTPAGPAEKAPPSTSAPSDKKPETKKVDAGPVAGPTDSKIKGADKEVPRKPDSPDDHRQPAASPKDGAEAPTGKSAAPATGGPTPEDGAALAAQFDDDFADPIANLTDEQRDAIVRWQGMDKFYARVQKFARDGVQHEEAEHVADMLDEAIASAVVPRDVTMYRGIRNSTMLFGVPNADLATLEGVTVRADGYMAASTSREQAVSGFTRPHIGGGPVLLELSIRAGTPALWVAGAGSPDMAEQAELLMGSAHALLIVSVVYSGDVPTVQAEVI